MAKVREEIEVLGAEEAAARLDKIAKGYANLERLHLTGKVSAEGYARATERLGLQEKLLGQNLQTSAKQMAQARAATDSMKSGYHDARNAADLLSYTVGVQLPRELKKVIAESKLIGPALSLAFKFTAVTAGIALIIGLADEIGKLTDKIFDWDGSLKAVLANQTELNKFIINQQQELRRLAEEYERIGLKGTDLLKVQAEQATRPLKEAQEELARLRTRWLELAQVSKEVRTLGAGDLGAGGLTPAAQKALKDMDALIQRHGQLIAEVATLQQAAANAGKQLDVAVGEEAAQKAAQFHEELKKIPRDGTLKEIAEQAREAAAAYQEWWSSLFGPGSSGFELGMQTQQQKQFEEMGILKPGITSAMEELKKEIPEVRDLHNQAFEEMARDIDSFIQRVFLTARSFGDIWKQLWTQLLGHFVSVISRMIAAWVMGHQQMAAAGGGPSLGSGQGGGIGGFIRNLFGFGGGAGSGIVSPSNPGGIGGIQGTFPMGQSSGISGITAMLPGALGGLGMSAGGNVGTGGVTAAGATVTTGAKLGLGAQLAQMLPMLIAGGGIFGGSKIGFGGPGRGALAGGLMGFAGALGGTMALSGASLSSILAIGSAFWPIGLGIAAVAALVGALFGMSARNKKKAQAMDILNAGRAEWKKIISDFEAHRIDYGSALGGITQVWQGMVQQWSNPALGKYGPIAIRNNEPEFRRTLQQIEDLQARRQWTASSPMFNAAGEFEKGGFVSPSLARPFGPMGIPPMPGGLRALPQFAAGGAVPAILHQREFVVNAPATASVGRENMEFINRTGRLPGGPAIIVQGPLVQAAPGMSEEKLAEATIRKLEQLLRDQGVSIRG